jgi:predicted kinase
MIILVSGLPGSGKSYFAEKLAARLGAVYLNSDQVRLTMKASGKYSFQDKLLVYREMANQTTRLLDEKKTVVIDATFYRQVMRDLFFKLAKDKSTPIRFINVIADEELIRERLKKPRKFSEADFPVYEKVRDEFEEITIPHLTLQSTNDNITWLLNKAIQYISDERK